jgi:hypothetical protein
VAKIKEDEDGKKTIVLNSSESAIVFGDEGIYQILSETFRKTLSEAQETQGASMIKLLEDCKDEDASKVMNEFVLIQVVNLLSEIMEGLASNPNRKP